MTDYLIRPRDPLMFRDGRPFAADPGASAESLPMPYPSTLAGALRTLAGGLTGSGWDKALATKVHALKVKGPLLAAAKTQDDWQTYLPAPADALVCTGSVSGGRRVMRLSPWRAFPGGCNPAVFRQVNGKVQFTGGAQLPLKVVKVEDENKPERGFDWWSLHDLTAWLSGADRAEVPKDVLAHPPKEDRTHVGIDGETLASKEGMLFTTESVALNDWARDAIPARALIARVEGWKTLPDSFFTPGGERRLASLQKTDIWPGFPEKLREVAEKGVKLLKLQLVTPAPFSTGWKPEWVDPQNLNAKVPIGIKDGKNIFLEKKLRLVSACVPRRQAVSGYSRMGPKAARYLAPAGSVYFFEVVGDEPVTVQEMEQLWLTSVCESPNDRGDGFGLAVPGVWRYAEGEE